MTEGDRLSFLERHHVSPSHGFLLEDPLDKLPPYFSAWESTCRRLPALIEGHQLRDVVDRMALLDHGRLEGHREWRLAHLMLTFIAQGYVWQEGDNGICRVLPKAIAVPLWAVSQYLGVKPVLSHLDCVLCNWAIIQEEKPLTVGNMKTIIQLPGGDAFDWFMLITAQIELDGVKGLHGICFCKEGIYTDTPSLVMEGLHMITESCERIKTTLSRMHERLPPEVFYNKVRPFLSGWGGESSPLPEGLVYEGVSQEPVQLSGGSAAQSTLLQCFDAALGISHETVEQAFLDKMREHMPVDHRNFIEEVKKIQIRQWIIHKNDSTLTGTYNASVQALKDLRSYHIQIVTRYVVIPSNKLKNKYEGVSKRGTGGQTLIPFLQSVRRSTGAAEVEI